MLNKLIISVLILCLNSFSFIILTRQSGAAYKTATPFVKLHSHWYMVEKSPLTLGDFTAQDAYWGFMAKKIVSSNSYGKVDLLDTFNISGYYLYNGEIKYFVWNTGSIQNDLDSIKTYLNSKWLSDPNNESVSSSKFSPIKQDSIATYLRIYKSDSVYAIVSLPSKSTVNIYKNYKSTWTLKTSINTSTNLSKNFKTQNNSTYFLGSNNLYNITTGSATIIATNVLDYSLDNQGVWLTNSSGELSYLKNGIRTTIKTGSQYARSMFIVNPIDTTFFSTGKITNSQYNDEDYNFLQGVSMYPVSWGPQRGYAVDKNNDIWNYFLGIKIEKETSYLKGTTFEFYTHHFNRIFDPSVDPERATYLLGDAIFNFKYNDRPFFSNNSFSDSLGYLDEQTQKIYYTDTIHAFDKSTNEHLYFSIIQNPIGLSLVDSIFTINKSIATGTYITKFQVRDNFSTPSFDTLTFTVKIYSRKISVNKSVTTTSIEDQLYSQIITTSDVDNDSSFISYSKLPSWLTISRISKNQFNVSGTPVNSTIDTTIKIIVTDNSHYFCAISNQYVNPSYDTLSYNLTVSKINEAPIITSSPSTSINFNNLYSYQVKATDEENDPLTYALTQKPTSMLISSNGYITWTPGISDAGNHTVTVKTSDPYGLYTTQSFTISVVNNNQPPVFTNTPETSVFVADEYNQYLYVSDENIFGLTFTKEAGPANLILTTSTISDGEHFIYVGWLFWNTMSPSDTGTYTVRIKVTDEFGLSSTKEFSLIVRYDGRKRVTIYPLSPDTSSTVGIQYTQNFNATSAYQNYFTIKLESGPSWLTYTKSSSSMNPTAKLTGTPTTAGRYLVKLSAYDWMVSDTLSYYINVASTLNSVPLITSTAITTASEDIAYSYQIIASDSNNDPLTYSLTSNPQGMTISSSGFISWTPVQSNVGSHVVTVNVADNKNASTTQSYTLNVAAVNDKPVITSIPVTIAYKDLGYSYQVEAYDVDNEILYYLLSAPEGMIVTSEGNIIWTPTASQIGVHNITLQVSDGLEATVQNYTVTVNDVNHAPIIQIKNDTVLTILKLNQPIEFNLKALDPDGDYLIYTFDTTGFDVTSMLVEVRDSNYIITLKKVMKDTIKLFVSDGKTQIQYSLIIEAKLSISIHQTFNKTFINYFKMTNKQICFGVAKNNNIKLIVYTMNGRALQVINETKGPGNYIVKLDSKLLASGNYIYKFNIGNEFSNTNKFQIVR